uniref:Uncharacterized protein n=1 Tax=Arundo donax TaxID=35708 RepID=A0A0A9EM34_ARUDO
MNHLIFRISDIVARGRTYICSMY